ncbi:MAG: DNA translocase FtsK, partial [Muribaculaceae bacterium]|nr:DNA translocase FtsK [Muribaculaceae bacterium]
ENHYLAKLPDAEEAIVTDMKKVVNTLNSLCIEMDNRYNLLKDAGVRSVEEYNAKFISRRLNPEKGHKYMPYIVVIVDEFADLIMTGGKDVERPVCRVAQKGRAAGLHMIIATQRPSVDVISGTIKANFPSRMAFKMSQMVDSLTILDRPGAQHLVGAGDMLILNGGGLDRVQCAFIAAEEVESICDCINNQTGFVHPYLLPEYISEEDALIGDSWFGDRDPLFEEAARFIVNSGVGSTSSLQRHYHIGYNRASRLIDQLEVAGIVGPSTGGKPRQILVDTIGLDQILGIEDGQSNHFEVIEESKNKPSEGFFVKFLKNMFKK